MEVISHVSTVGAILSMEFQLELNVTSIKKKNPEKKTAIRIYVAHSFVFSIKKEYKINKNKIKETHEKTKIIFSHLKMFNRFFICLLNFPFPFSPKAEKPPNPLPQPLKGNCGILGTISHFGNSKVILSFEEGEKSKELSSDLFDSSELQEEEGLLSQDEEESELHDGKESEDPKLPELREAESEEDEDFEKEGNSNKEPLLEDLEEVEEELNESPNDILLPLLLTEGRSPLGTLSPKR